MPKLHLTNLIRLQPNKTICNHLKTNLFTLKLQQRRRQQQQQQLKPHCPTTVNMLAETAQQTTQFVTRAGKSAFKRKRK